MRGPVTATSLPTHSSYHPRQLLNPKQQTSTPTSSSKMSSKSPSMSPRHRSLDSSPTPPDIATVLDLPKSGSTSMLEGLYGAERRQDLPQKRKRIEAIVIDDDDDDKNKDKKRNITFHKGTGIIGEYMKEGKDLAPPSNSLPVDLTKGNPHHPLYYMHPATQDS